MKLGFRGLLLLLLAFPLPGAAQPPPPAAPGRPAGTAPLLVPGKTTLFQRVITRPGAAVSPEPAAAATARPLPGFTALYVFDRRGGDAGWVQVGPAADAPPVGWVPAAGLIDWRHTMVASFTNPAGRKPVLFLENEAAERRLMLATDAGAQAEALRRAAANGNPGPVVATEPARFVDINRTFYLLPIMKAEVVDRETGPVFRLLNVLSAPADPPPAAPNAPAGASALRDYKAGVVFLIDTTSSMQPYIEATRDAVRTLVGTIGGTAVKNNFRFGVVGYRDSLEDNPGLEYATRVFAKPDFAQPADAVLAALAQVRESRVSSTGFAEDPLGGLYTALNEIDWSGLSARYVILVTDAGGRGPRHPRSLTRMGTTELRIKAAEKKVAVMAFHLLTPDGARANDHNPARAFYQDLTQFNGTEPLYFPIPGGDRAVFRQQVDAVVGQLLAAVAATTGVPVEALRLPQAPGAPPGAPPGQAADAPTRERLRVVTEAMRLNDVRRVDAARAPDVQSSWTTDRDLGNPETFSLDVRVLLTRNQLSDLAASLQRVLDAGLAGRTRPELFFDQLRSAFAAAATDPQRMNQLTGAANVGSLLGEYLDGLPYRSQIMDIDQDSWVQRGPIAQRAVLNDVESRLRLYQEFQAQTELWHDLSRSGRRGEEVYAVPLEALP